MNDLEISKALALAIGWKQNQMQVAGPENSLLICIEIATLKSEAYWRKFDYRDPDVIWPIAKKYKCFPELILDGNWWAQSAGDIWGYVCEDTPEKAVAMAVIKRNKK